MLISVKTTQPILIFLSTKEAQQLFRQLQKRIVEKYVCVLTGDAKNEILGPSGPPLPYALSVKEGALGDDPLGSDVTSVHISPNIVNV